MNITDTGLRGYLKWLKRDQPGLYQLIAPHLAQQVPEAFSDFEQSRAMGTLMGLGEDTSQAADVADAANSGASTPTVTSLISNLVGAASQIFLAKSQVDTLKEVNQIQLQRAQMGLSPLNTSSLSLGIPQVNVGLSQGTMTGGGIAIAVLGGLGLLMFFGGGKHRRAR
jgi:hypothetical protein